MTKRRLFLWLATASGYLGLGMLLGYSFGDHTIATALWVGIVLVLAAAVLLGMYISSRSDVVAAKITVADDHDTPAPTQST